MRCFDFSIFNNPPHPGKIRESFLAEMFTYKLRLGTMFHKVNLTSVPLTSERIL